MRLVSCAIVEIQAIRFQDALNVEVALRAGSGAGTARIEFDILVGAVNSYLLAKSDHREFGS